MQKTLGLILLVVGIIMLIWTGFSYTKREKVIDAGPLQVVGAERRQAQVRRAVVDHVGPFATDARPFPREDPQFLLWAWTSRRDRSLDQPPAHRCASAESVGARRPLRARGHARRRIRGAWRR